MGSSKTHIVQAALTAGDLRPGELRCRVGTDTTTIEAASAKIQYRFHWRRLGLRA